MREWRLDGGRAGLPLCLHRAKGDSTSAADSVWRGRRGQRGVWRAMERCGRVTTKAKRKVRSGGEAGWLAARNKGHRTWAPAKAYGRRCRGQAQSACRLTLRGVGQKQRRAGVDTHTHTYTHTTHESSTPRSAFMPHVLSTVFFTLAACGGQKASCAVKCSYNKTAPLDCTIQKGKKPTSLHPSLVPSRRVRMMMVECRSSTVSAAPLHRTPPFGFPCSPPSTLGLIHPRCPHVPLYTPSPWPSPSLSVSCALHSGSITAGPAGCCS